MIKPRLTKKNIFNFHKLFGKLLVGLAYLNHVSAFKFTRVTGGYLVLDSQRPVPLDRSHTNDFTDHAMRQISKTASSVKLNPMVQKAIMSDDEEALEPEEVLRALTVDQLKAALKGLGLRVSGRKAELVRRLADAGYRPPALPPAGPAAGEGAAAAAAAAAAAEVVGVGASAEAVVAAARAQERAAEIARNRLEREQYEANQNWKPLDNFGGLPEALNGTSPVIDDLMLRREVVLNERTPEWEGEGEEGRGEEKEENEEFSAYLVQARAAVQPWTQNVGLKERWANREVKAVLLLPDVFGWAAPHTRAVADQIAAVCEAAVLVPDLFRGDPWDPAAPSAGPEYEAWRAAHPAARAAGDARRAAEYLRREFNASALALVGFCYGGGRAIEEAATGQINPDVLAVFYPTRYDAACFAQLKCPTLGIFGEEDELGGAKREDAMRMHQLLSENEQVQDFVVRIFKGEGHGFAHMLPAVSGISETAVEDEESASPSQSSQDAMLLATAWLDIYLRTENPTTGERAKRQRALWED